MSYDQELTFAKELAHEAGTIMRRYFRAEDIGTEWKEDNTPLTVADTKINSLVIKKIKAAFPEHGVLGEEESYEPDRQMVWIVDPIDGTNAFSLAMPWSTFSLALVDRSIGQTQVAVVYDPHLDHLYWAVRGGGAFINDTKIQVSKATEFKQNFVSLLEGKTTPKSFKVGECRDLIRSWGGKSFSLLSSVYSASRVASGELIGAMICFGYSWDYAAVALIVEEAGGLVTDLDGQPRRADIDDGYIMAANQPVLDKLLAAVKATRP